MSPEAQQLLTGIALFVLGMALGYLVRLQKHMDEVRQWKAIARRAQMLNTLAAGLNAERERSANGSN